MEYHVICACPENGTYFRKRNFFGVFVLHLIINPVQGWEHAPLCPKEKQSFPCSFSFVMGCCALSSLPGEDNTPPLLFLPSPWLPLTLFLPITVPCGGSGNGWTVPKNGLFRVSLKIYAQISFDSPS
uniref:Uncharacterized protein n=1 Tax=Trieres chinensis TaxID=1514140 RepID=A0A7S2E9T6_TRICV